MAKGEYKKHMKAGWRQGKSAKGDGEERQRAKAEAIQLLKEMDEEYKPTYKKGKRKRNMKAHLEYAIGWYTERLEYYKAKGINPSWLKTGLERAKKAYEKYAGKK